MIQRRGSVLESFLIIVVVSTVMLGIAFTLGGVLTFMREYDNDSKKEQFRQGQLFRCHSENYSSKRLLLSKEDGWEIYKEEFKKDATIIPISRCEVEEGE